MALGFRGKLMSIVVTATTAFVVIILASAFITARVQRQLGSIQGQYLPLVELGPRLDTQFERIRHAFQEAVATHDVEGLTEASALEREFFEQLAEAKGAVDPADAAALHSAVEEYCRAASDVSRRLVAGETGEAIVDSMSAMQAKNVRTSQLLRKTTTFDRDKLTETFLATSVALRTAGRVQILVSTTCLGLVIVFSVWLSRGVLGDVNRQASLMAQDLRLANEDLRAQKENLQRANEEMESFSYSVSHDLRAPLRSIDGFSQVLLEDNAGQLDDEGKKHLRYVRESAQQMGELIDGLLALSQVTRSEYRQESVDISRIARGIATRLQRQAPERGIEFVVHDGLSTQGDGRLLGVVLENLLNNAAKFTRKSAAPRIEVGLLQKDGVATFFVRDNGAGFDMKYAGKLFGAFQRLHASADFEGTGIGLATVQRIVRRHGGRIWAEGEVGTGAVFFFTCPLA